MANIVLGIGCAHELQLDTPHDQREADERADIGDGSQLWYRGERVTYDNLLAQREGAEDRKQSADHREGMRRVTDALHTLKDEFARAAPDIVVIFGTDHDEMFHDDIKPAFTIMGCESFAIAGGNESTFFPGHPVLATYLTKSALQHDFDISYSQRQHCVDGDNEDGMPHAYEFIYSRMISDTATPNVPIDINTYFPPNQPPASRCYALGRLVGKAIRSWDNDARIAIVASGGLSHPAIDEEFDRDIIEAMESGDFRYLVSYHEGHYQSGSSQIKTWMAMGGAIQGSYLKGQTIDYCPLYRTEAGTGDSAAFMIWR